MKTDKRPKEEKHPPTRPTSNRLFCLLVGSVAGRQRVPGHPHPIHGSKHSDRVSCFVDQETGLVARFLDDFFFLGVWGSQNCLLEPLGL